MSLLASFEASSPALVLGPTLEALPSVDIAIERQYALNPARPILFCWVRHRDRERVEHALATDATVADFERIGGVDGRDCYRLQRSDTDVVAAYRRWVAAGGELLDCRGSDGRWEVEMRFPDRASFSDYHDFLADEGVTLELHRLSDGDDRRHGSESALTDAQREALVLAHERGFFEVPRETGLSEVADRLGISTQAVSERLRRGQAQLIEAQLLE
ncbi:helix-turn-helix domain-containing protein [Natrinema sp. 1APR25-10V2]|uniref:helix-turn-helix domain-containing protein n=1 Tax=Natrinema sp. 1APR25-10V2 TaxID=2951081 RepID=UPI002876033A|nr:helix-turn-helix domain-containing protein [Natrinema sp. 1APR25-10V2]MDS0475599.1 helix-turn-helix domain-containing protein [Natrinema sp. 1APR25-10V2]